MLQAAAVKYTTIKAFSGDEGHGGTAVKFFENTLGLKLHISKKIKDAFAILPMRWDVERTFAWLAHYRRLSKDYEILKQSAKISQLLICLHICGLVTKITRSRRWRLTKKCWALLNAAVALKEHVFPELYEQISV